MRKKNKLIRITTVPESLGLFKGQPRFMSSYFEVIGVASPGKKVKEVEELENIKIFTIPMTRTISPFKDIIALCKLYFFLKQEKPAIVHSHTPKAGTLAMIASFLAGVPHRLHTVAGMPLITATGFKRVILNMVERITYACATKVYPNSFGLRQFIVDNHFATESKIKVIANGSSNGIDTAFFDPVQIGDLQKDRLRDELKISSNDFVFIFMGRLVTDKGINELISAFKNLNQTYSDTKLLLLGYQEKELDPLDRKTIHEIENNSSILAVGFQSDVRPYLAISHCLTFPSYREGFPNVVMQAGAMGLPSIVTDINGCNEIIIEGINGLLVQPGDTKNLQEKMFLLLSNDVVRRNLGCNAREKIVSRYNQKDLWEEILMEYRNLTEYV